MKTRFAIAFILFLGLLHCSSQQRTEKFKAATFQSFSAAVGDIQNEGGLGAEVFTNPQSIIYYADSATMGPANHILAVRSIAFLPFSIEWSSLRSVRVLLALVDGGAGGYKSALSFHFTDDNNNRKIATYIGTAIREGQILNFQFEGPEGRRLNATSSDLVRSGQPRSTIQLRLSTEEGEIGRIPVLVGFR